VSTNALELGIDIGSLDAAVMAGYPGTIASTWQRAGRAAEEKDRHAPSWFASSRPLDQFIVRHPEYFFSASPNMPYIQPDNLEILIKSPEVALHLSSRWRRANVSAAGFEHDLRTSG